MREILEELQKEVGHRGLAGALVVVGVSGGPDSVALWHLLRALPDGLRPRMHLCHVDHGWRPGAQAREEEICLRLARAAGAGSSVIHLPAPLRRSEEDARERRLGALARVAAALGAQAVALAHQQDDQAETVLMQLVRGSARATGIAPWREPFWRPLLGVPRKALEAVCREAGLSYSDDETNRGDEFLRSRLRSQVLPLLRRENPQVAAALARYATLRRADDLELGEAAEALLRRLVPLPGGIDLRPLAQAPPPLARRALWRIVRQRGSDLAAARLEEALDSLRAGRRHAITRGLWLEAGAIWWGAPRPSAVTLVDGGRARFGEIWAGIGAPPAGALSAAIGAGTVVVRGRLAGDRLRIGPGTRKLQDIHVDAKLPRPLRDLVPVVTLDGAPVWLPGFGTAPEAGPRRVWVAPASVVTSLWSVLK